MSDQYEDCENRLKESGWKTISGRWWKPEFHPLQNTLTFDEALEREGIKPKDPGPLTTPQAGYSPCGCYVTCNNGYEKDAIEYCPKHKSVDALVAALKQIVDYAGMRHEAEKRVEVMKHFAQKALQDAGEL